MTPGEALAATGVDARAAGPGDAVAGVTPRWVALPESTGEVALVMRAAAEHGLAVVPAGGGTKLSWGYAPTRCDLLLDTRRMNRVLEHEAGDLVVRVQAGVTAAALASALGEAGQQLALDVMAEEATVGGVLATAAAGPRRLRHGTPRDLLIGITVVLADGTIARSGGKVVKNVAGYDLGKLFTGSLGTLGVITEATFRLHPLPASRAWVTATSPDPRVLTAVATLAGSQLEPSALELDRPGTHGPLTVAALFEGVAAAERAKAAAELLGDGSAISSGPPAWWARLPGERPAPDPAELLQETPGGHPTEDGPGPRLTESSPGDRSLEERVPQGGGFLLELRVPPAFAGRALAAVAWASDDAGGPPVHVRGSAASCVLHLAVPVDTPPGAAEIFVTSLRSEVAGDGGRLVVWTAPPEAAARLDRFGPVGAATLMRRVKERFDPEGRMSPGRLAGAPPAGSGT
ncbi:FAD-binding oxidoreductase [Sphaerisporangium album]|uniref:FAD-binding oxidoreductase n=1 Tax=Sphaerisporangium album TaxID=509200 RepID=A0A367FRJ5_9ACTN|nr:FAD-binding oxidoreductase [Sphaerisporangium album]RCG32854.1 FAD-binding oxidoreductase [Sphaerisporangium album]